MDKYYATGRRKNSIAKVWLTKGDGQIIINKRGVKEYFPREFWVNNALEALDVTGTSKDFNFNISVLGGGLTGQSGAVRLGISKAILLYNESFRSKLKPKGLLTRDSRMVESKKYGKKKARKGQQFSKR
ncbi:30S ribosomal protein S9 [bacterium]|nr:30S ribosomal protein S9 [bacterium]MBT3850309.1 30S ribosomal protein S9 [bacterium]MBT4435488.1 30S ribosomal protein S9 [bacterium]MDG2445870.1 30S ribosomal protein S9 [Thermodesulfobacteriota bacterium]